MNDVRAAQIPRFLFRVALIALVLPALQGCGDTPPRNLRPPLSEPFVEVPHEHLAPPETALGLDATSRGLRQSLRQGQTGRSFYLALRKDALGKRFFLSSFLRQHYPEPRPGHAPLSTRVVSFEAQNGLLVLFDREDRHQFSSTYRPEIIIDAFPIVADYEPFHSLPGAEDYVLFDPAAGRNEFSAMGTIRGPSANSFQDSGYALETHTTFLQAFRRIEDGVTFEKVFGATSNVNGRLLNHAGTLGISLRRYTESEGFERLSAPPRPHFFVSLPHWIPNTAQQRVYATRWHIQEGMRPIEWVVSAEALELAKSPLFAGADLVGAIRRGVEAWNAAFGFTVLQTRLAGPDDNEGQDDKNFIIIDINPSANGAMGHLRSNPNTGEIRGASIYLGSGMLDYLMGLAGIGGGTPREDVPPGEGEGTQLTWNAQPSASFCELGPSGPLPGDMMRGAAEVLGASAREQPALSAKEKAERLVQWLVMHEVGHTLGLRHNFKGSLTAPVSSVMDYLAPEDQFALSGPGAYDLAAIDFLYGKTAEAPDAPFCTDEGAATDPDCVPYDSGTNPFDQQYAPMYEQMKRAWLEGDAAASPYLAYYLEHVLRYTTMGRGEAAAVANHHLLLDGARPAIPADVLASHEGYAGRADLLTQNVLTRLYSAGKAPAYASLAYEVLTDFGAILENEDGIRSFASRRFAADVLKRFQTAEAHTVLRMARGTIDQQRASATGEEREMLEDLYLRVDRALTPYFN